MKILAEDQITNDRRNGNNPLGSDLVVCVVWSCRSS